VLAVLELAGYKWEYMYCAHHDEGLKYLGINGGIQLVCITKCPWLPFGTGCLQGVGSAQLLVGDHQASALATVNGDGCLES